MYESGFYVGIWVLNVSYVLDDIYFYEYDVYFGYLGEFDGIVYDFGYLYYNYDVEVEFDFVEIYGLVGMGGVSVIVYLFVYIEVDEVEG